MTCEHMYLFSSPSRWTGIDISIDVFINIPSLVCFIHKFRTVRDRRYGAFKTTYTRVSFCTIERSEQLLVTYKDL